MSLHYYPQATYRYRSAAQQQQHLHREQLHQQQQYGSDSDGNDYSEYDNGDEEEADNGDEEEDEDEEDDEDEDGELDDDPDLPYEGFVPVALKYLHQTTRPRNWCLCLITNPWFERVSMMVILLNCITLGMYQPCVDDQCETNRCKILQMFDDIIFAFFALEMTIKMVAMGIYGKGTYLADSWNRLDFFIVIAGALEYCLNVENMNLSAIRTIRVLRPLRAINRIPSMRILVMLLLDTLPMLGNVLLLCFFVFFIFGIVGVQLWEGILRQRCFLKPHPNVKYPELLSDEYSVRSRIYDLEKFFEYQGQDYICSRMDDNGMHSCSNLPRLKIGNIECNETALPNSNLTFLNATSCVNWNAYYTECKGQGNNPFQGTISFDNIGLAWVAIFLVISLEGWTDIMYYVQDAHSFWDWIYFVLLIVIGSFFMINLCLVVIATQFSETKKREMERMRLERARFHSTSTLASSTNTSEPTSCYAEIVKYIAHLWRRGKRRLLKKYRLFMISRRHQRDQNLLRDPSQSRRKIVKSTRLLDGKLHHSRCPRLLAAREAEQLHQSNGMANNNNNINNNNNNNGTAASATDLADPSGGSGTIVVSPVGSAPRASPEVSEVELPINNHNHHHHHHQQQQHRHTSLSNGSDNNINVLNETNNALLSPPSAPQRRRSSVMFSEVILLHGSSVNTLPGSIGTVTGERNICSSEKMTQTGDGNVWAMTSQPNNIQAEIGGGEAMTCQELLAFSGALSAALPTGQVALDTFLNSLTKGMSERHVTLEERSQWTAAAEADACSCCCDMQNDPQWPEEDETAAETSQRCLRWKQSKFRRFLVASGNIFVCTCCCLRRWTKKLVNHKYFQQGILLAILINTLSMGIEYHNQPDELTFIVEISNIVFSAIFAVEMLLKVIAEGPFGYISNGFNVFDGVVVVLSVVELCQSFGEEKGGSSGLSVLRTFRLLRILKLVRFMPNLRRQLFVMLRTMDNVAVFFSLLVLFIFIFSILGMYLFGGKFCVWADRSRPCTCAEVVSRHPLCRCDRKHFNDIVWALVTVFQILTQEDWNVVLFNGMQKTSHWAALYFVALMTFGNYVLFNLLVAILVEGFSSERNERREREQRELARIAAKEAGYGSEEGSSRVSRSHSVSDSDTYTQDQKNSWQSCENVHKYKGHNHQCHEKYAMVQQAWRAQPPFDVAKCNLTKEIVVGKKNSVGGPQPPIITHTAATPQDSPNTTLDTHAYRDLSFRAAYPPALSIESIDRSSSQCSVYSGYLKPVENNSKNSLNNPVKRPNTAVNASAQKECLSSSPPRIPKGWRLSRQSSRRKRSLWEEDAAAPGRPVILNNGRSSVGHKSLSCGDYTTYNNGYLQGSIRNDTHCDFPNNRSTAMINNHSLSPNNSVRSRRSSVQCRYTPRYHWTEELSRRTSLRGFESLATRKILPVEEVPLSSPAHTINNLSHHEMTAGALPSVKPRYSEEETELNLRNGELTSTHSNELGTGGGGDSQTGSVEKIKKIFMFFEPKGCLKERDDYSLYIFPPNNRFRELCHWFVEQKWFDNVVLLFIGLNCITLAMERPNIPPDSKERIFLASANYVFTAVFAVEMFVKVVATGMLYGTNAYFTSGWNIMDGSLVVISIIDLGMSLLSSSSPRIFGILRVFRLLRSLRPLRVINRAPGLKLVVQTLLSSLRPIGNIVLICCTFFVIFGILGVQLFKGAFYYCDGPDIKNVRNKTDCLSDSRNVWLNRKYNFDDLGKALMSLFVLSSRDGWVNIMYTGLDAVGVDQQPIENYSEWRLLYFISFILLVGFFVLNMFVGVVVENFHRCREEQEKEERVRRAAKRALQMEKKRRKMHEPPYYNDYCKSRLFVHNVVTSKYFDLAIAAVIGLNVVTMALEFYMMPKALTYALKIFNYFFTAVFILESAMKLLALGLHLYLKDKWNQLDIGIVILSVVGIVLEEVESKIIPINPTIIRVMRVLRIARVLKLLKMAKGIRALLDTVMQALPQVGNLGLLFFLLFFIFAALGVELFGRLECSDEYPCQGLGEHAHFSNFGMAFLTLFRVATGDNWNGIMKDTLRDNCDDAADCVKNCCVSNIIAPIFFVIFVLMAQFVLVNVVVAVLMKHLEESHKQMEDELDMENQLERELAAEQEELLEEVEEEDEPEDVDELMKKKDRSDVLDEKDEMELNEADGSDEFSGSGRPGLSKVRSLPSNFTYNPPAEREKTTDDYVVLTTHGLSTSMIDFYALKFLSISDLIEDAAVSTMDDSRHSIYQRAASSKPAKFKVKRRQTFHSQDREPPGGGGGVGGSQSSMHFEVAELIRKPNSNLSVPRIIPQRGGGGSTNSSNASIPAAVGSTKYLAVDNKSSYLRPSSVESFQQRRGSNQSTTSDSLGSSKQKHFLCPVADVSLAKARIPTPELASSSTSLVLTGASRSSSMSSHGAGGGLVVPNARRDGRESDSRTEPYATSSPISMLLEEPVDVQSIINERRPSRLKPVAASPLAGYGLYVKEEDEEEEEKNEQSARGSAAIGQPTNSSRSSGSGVELCIFVDGSAASPEQREQETQVGDGGEERSASSDKSSRRRSPSREDNGAT
ncbi:voltage-dependent T-type calcium channel subunit alpha-1G isoform X4 [Trichogramma pretiosum]|uniref:voltage-dependent T-type calcium channel subunit alpha-1G isoform X4 n=1 Tax=Trichogramma pretiosum TaxID=7493 RepID=UPI000C71BB28|nr:voltage-dependent T-type calcium channel subunit alpha-1G isoform X4 [Trichogramma pretiosum]